MRTIFALAVLLPLNLPAIAEVRRETVFASGSLDFVVTQMLQADVAHEAQHIMYSFYHNGSSQDIDIKVFNSRLSRSAGSEKDNCVSFPRSLRIECDLSILDNLIDELHPDKIWIPASDDPRRWFRRQLLTLIISHELGHIALKHGISHFDEPKTGFSVFDVEGHKVELDADAFAIQLIGKNRDIDDTILAISNSLLRKATCPETYPEVCARMPAGVGVIYDYTSNSKPIRVKFEGSHPAYIARFLRMLYFAAGNDPIRAVVTRAIGLLYTEKRKGVWDYLKNIFKFSELMDTTPRSSGNRLRSHMRRCPVKKARIHREMALSGPSASSVSRLR